MIELNKLKIPTVKLIPVGPAYMEYMGINPEIMNEIGVMTDKLTTWSTSEGVEYVDKLLTDYTESPVLHTFRSTIYVVAGDYDGAIASLERSLEYLPDHLHIKLNLLKTHVQFERFDKVVEMITTAPSIVKFAGGKTEFYVGDFLEFYTAASALVAHRGDVPGLGEIMTLAEQYLKDKNDMFFFQTSTRSHFDIAMKNWMLNKAK